MSAHKHTPMEVAAARAICRLHSDMCHVDFDDDWNIYSSDFLKEAKIALDAAAAPELLEALIKKVKDAEQRFFEDWLEFSSPSGAHEEVQRQWLASNDYRGFIGEWGEQIAAIAKATGEQP